MKDTSQTKTSNKKVLVGVFLVAAFFGGAVGWFLPHPSVAAIYRGSIVRKIDSNTDLISPLLAADVGSEQAFPELFPAKGALTSIINAAVARGDAQNVSVYYRLLNSGRWFEINGSTLYAPASLLKTFVMMAYFSEAENTDDPGLLQKAIRFEATASSSVETPGQVIPHLVAGKWYSIEDVIRQMIMYSDNDALNTLVDNFDPDTLSAFDQIFVDLKIPSPSSQSESAFNFLSADQYSLVFRVLYSTTYLSPRYSQLALSILSQAQYKEGLVAGTPQNIVVSHKFGVATDPASATSPALPELHDCGIVYYPSHPYILCVMTRGTNFATLQQLISKLSSTAYSQTQILFKQ